MPLYERVRGLEGAWEDSVRVDELSELWRSRWDVVLIDSSTSDDFDVGSLPELLDGSDCDERDQDLEDRQLGLDASGLIHYPEDIVVYGGIPFGSVLSPQELLRHREEYETRLNREDSGKLCRVVHPQIASVIYGGLFGHSWLVPHCLALSILDVLACPRCGSCWSGPVGVAVYSLTGVSVFVTDRGSAGVTNRQLRTREQCYEWRSVCILAGSSVRHLFGRGTHMIVLVLDLNGLTFYRGSYPLAGLNERCQDQNCRGGVPEGNPQPNRFLN
jgi:hypothetical protein